MNNLIDFLTFKDKSARPTSPALAESDIRLRRDERDAAVLSGKYPPTSNPSANTGSPA